jgi:hypothetical protein
LDKTEKDRPGHWRQCIQGSPNDVDKSSAITEFESKVWMSDACSAVEFCSHTESSHHSKFATQIGTRVSNDRK